MRYFVLLLVGLFGGACAMFPWGAPPPDPLATARAVTANESSATHVWPGYWSQDIPFLIYRPGGDAIVASTQGRPEGFDAVEAVASSRRTIYRYEGTPPGLSGTVDLNYRIGPDTVVAIVQDRSVGNTVVTLFHERFHVYQDTYFAGESRPSDAGGADDLTPEKLALAAVERELLDRALSASNDDTLRSLVESYLTVREKRAAMTDSGMTSVELDVERREGSATLVGYQGAAAVLDRTDDRVTEFIQLFLANPLTNYPGSVAERMYGWRLYGTGAAIGLILDRLGAPNWRGRLEGGAVFPDLLAEALSFVPPGDEAVLGEILRRFGYDAHLESPERTWGSLAVRGLKAFYVRAGAVVNIIVPASQGHLLASHFNGSFVTPADSVTWIEPEIYSVQSDRISIVVRGPDVLHDRRTVPSISIAVDRLPDVSGITRGGEPRRFERLSLDGRGYDVRLDRPVEAALVADTLFLRIVP